MTRSLIYITAPFINNTREAMACPLKYALVVRHSTCLAKPVQYVYKDQILGIVGVSHN